MIILGGIEWDLFLCDGVWRGGLGLVEGGIGKLGGIGCG